MTFQNLPDDDLLNDAEEKEEGTEEISTEDTDDEGVESEDLDDAI